MKENSLCKTNNIIQQSLVSNKTLHCIQLIELKDMKQPSNKLEGRFNNYYSDRTNNNNIYCVSIRTNNTYRFVQSPRILIYIYIYIFSCSHKKSTTLKNTPLYQSNNTQSKHYDKQFHIKSYLHCLQFNDNKTELFISSLNSSTLQSVAMYIVSKSLLPQLNNNKIKIFKCSFNSNILHLNSVANNKASTSFLPTLTSNQLGGKNNNKTEMTQNEPRNNNNCTDNSQIISIHEESITRNQSLNTSPYPLKKITT